MHEARQELQETSCVAGASNPAAQRKERLLQDYEILAARVASLGQQNITRMEHYTNLARKIKEGEKKKDELVRKLKSQQEQWRSASNKRERKVQIDDQANQTFSMSQVAAATGRALSQLFL